MSRIRGGRRHRIGEPAGVDLLEDAEQRRKLIRFLLSIDAFTPRIEEDTAVTWRATDVPAGNVYTAVS